MDLPPDLTSLGRLVGLAITSVQTVDADLIPPAQLSIPEVTPILQGAKVHRVQGLLATALARHPSLKPSPAILEGVGQLARLNAFSALSQTAEVGRLLGLFGQAGIPALTLKGVVLSQMLYGSVSARGAGDIDLLIAPETFPEAHGLLSQAGYTCADGGQTGSAPRADLLPLHKDILYTHPERHTLELHLSLWDQATPVVTFQLLWKDRQLVNMPGGYIAPTLPRTIMPAYLVAHGVHHCWDRLSWLADLQMLEHSEGGECGALCAQYDLKHEYDLAIQLGRLLLDLPRLPDPPSTALRRFLSAFYVGSRWIDRPERGCRQWVIRELRMRLWRGSRLRDWTQRRHALKRILMNPVDAAFIPLPSFLVWAYPLLRPVGWVLRNFFRRKYKGCDRAPNH